jgi:hypothetical protein
LSQSCGVVPSALLSRSAMSAVMPVVSSAMVAPYIEFMTRSPSGRFALFATGSVALMPTRPLWIGLAYRLAKASDSAQHMYG